MKEHTDITIGAAVTTADGKAIGKVIEVLTGEFIVEDGHLVKHLRAFHYSDIGTATPQHVVLTLGKDAIEGDWNIVTQRNAKGQDRHVVQVGTPRTNNVPYYDEVQTTTGGPPTGEAEC